MSETKKHPLDTNDDLHVDTVKRQKQEEDAPAIDVPLPSTDIDMATADREDGAKRFQLKLLNMSKYTTVKDLKKILETEGITAIKTKKVHSMDFGIVWFETMEQRTVAAEKLDGLTYKKSTMGVELVDKDSGEVTDERKEKNQKGGRGRRNGANDEEGDERTPQEKINDQVTPLWRKPYETQLLEKTNSFKNAFGTVKKKLTEFLFNKDISKENKEPLMWLKTHTAKNRRGICTVHDCVPSPILTGYRSKCEFTFGFDLEGKPAVGFMLGLFKDGIVTVLSAEECLNVSKQAVQIVKEMEHVAVASSLPIFNRLTKTGFWRLLQIRTQDSGESMMIVQTDATGISAEQLKEAQEAVVKRFSGDECAVKVTTVLWQNHSGAHNGISETSPFEVVLGPGFVHETLLGLSFQISPTAFFQINTKGTELLYTKIRDLCLTSPAAPLTDADASTNNIVLLDLCCGTGTIGITMASKVKKVIGIEMVKEAVMDARVNAERNGVSNVVYFDQKVEDAIKVVLGGYGGSAAGGKRIEEGKKAEEEKKGDEEKKEEEEVVLEIKEPLVQSGDVVVAVLDPPRTGVHPSVVKAVRACEGIDRIIYVSCDFKQAMGNIIDFCRPSSNKFKGKPFRPLQAFPFDLFPHTTHCELIIELRRVDDECFKVAETEEGASGGESSAAVVADGDAVMGDQAEK
ncbi:tRNA methyltransferase 2 [Dinochytrium kinnereticum]|nr:tRNA methyltransferase 2 [Dinochytrium kinnereticum]